MKQKRIACGSRPLTAAAVRRELKPFIDPSKAAFYRRFFETGPGEYGEGDVVVPHQRRVARRFAGLPRQQIDRWLSDRYHECRFTGLLILVRQFEQAGADAEKREILVCDLRRADAVNNRDLVDGSARQIAGRYLADKVDRSLLQKLARSKNLWQQRIAVIATWALIKQGEYDEILQLAVIFVSHPHDLIHKAVGWMLREVGKQDRAVLLAFFGPNCRRHAPYHAEVFDSAVAGIETMRLSQPLILNR